jgi:hypothetical protein
MYSGCGFQGILLGIFFDPLLQSDEGPALEGHAPCIIYSCAFDSPHAYPGHPLQVGVLIVVITFWLGHESIQTGAQVGYPSRPTPQKVAPGDKSSARRKAEKALLMLIGTARIKCGVGSHAIRSQSLFPQFTPHFIVLGIWNQNVC